MNDPRVPFFRTERRLMAVLHETVEDGPPPVPGGRPKGCKRLHTNATVAAVRRLIESTTLTYKQIAERTGTSAGTVGTCDGKWPRHPFAPRATDLVPTARASRRLKLRMLGKKLETLAERCVTELWNSPSVDLDRLVEAMQVFRMARLDAMGSRRPRRYPKETTRTGQDWTNRDAAIQKALKELRFGGVIVERIPEDAMLLLEEAYTPPRREQPGFVARGPRRRR
jgi:hypothetical protein